MASRPIDPVGEPKRLACMEVYGGNRADHRLVHMPGLETRVLSLPYGGAEQGGGDLYFLSLCAGGRISRVALLDVAGHGASVSQLAVTLRRIMRRTINTPRQEGFARRLNQVLAGMSIDGSFATAVFVSYFHPTQELRVCNAGHPRPIHREAASGTWRLLGPDADADTDDIPSNLPLGVVPGTEYEQFKLHLVPGDMLLMYTDPFIEACDEEGRQLGEEGLLELVSDGSCPDEIDLVEPWLLDRVTRYRAGRPADDDQTLMLLCADGSPRTRHGPLGYVASACRMMGMGHRIDS
jgi:serine phosphatase RsbU (regulator of sigma subunit)